VRDRDELRRALDGGAEEGELAPAHPRRQRLRIEHHGEVVDGRDRRHRRAQRQGLERRPEQVDVARRQAPRQPGLLPDHPERRALPFDRDPGRAQALRRPRLAVGEADELELAAARQPLGELERVDADAGRLADHGPQVDGDAGATGGGDLVSPGGSGARASRPGGGVYRRGAARAGPAAPVSG
jgi:hypothetical protein